MEAISYTISSIFVCITIMYIYLNVHGLKFKLDIARFLVLLVHIILFVISPIFLPPFYKQIFNIIVMYFVSYYAVAKDIKSAIVDAIYIEIICVTSEIIYTIFYMFIHAENLMLWNKSFVGILVTNIVVPVIMIVINRHKIFKKLHSLLGKFTDYLSNNKVVVLLLTFFIIVNILFYVVYYIYYSNKIILYIIIVLMFFLYAVILFIILYTSNSYEKMKGKYSLSLENIKGYEQMLNQYRVSNHENKNQLLLIRNMVKDKKTIKYIDEIINNKEKDDNDIYNVIKRIPTPSIRAVIYSKVLVMRNKGISYTIENDRKISYKDFETLDDNIILDICNVLNVFLDNAIDAVSSLPKRQILIEINKENDEIVIAISNLYDGIININQIYNPGYSTKGEEHGYGLVVVKRIVDSYKELSNTAELKDNVFTQYLYIKINKKM